MTLVFVYGSLLSGMHNHRVLDGARLVGSGRTPPRFTLRDLGAFPALVAGGNTAVAGEIYAVDGEILERLDRLEEHPVHYRREPVQLEDGPIAYAYIYVARPREHARAIPSGDWRGHKEKSQ